MRENILSEHFIPDSQLTWAPRKATSSNLDDVKLFISKVCKIDSVYQQIHYSNNTALIDKNRQKFLEFIRKEQLQQPKKENDQQKLLQDKQNQEILKQLKQQFDTQLDRQLEKEGLRYDLLIQFYKSLKNSEYS